jgi:hypothetical protein
MCGTFLCLIFTKLQAGVLLSTLQKVHNNGAFQTGQKFHPKTGAQLVFVRAQGAYIVCQAAELIIRSSSQNT